MTKTTHHKLILWLPLLFMAFYTSIQISKIHVNAHASLSLTSGNYSASLSGDESTSAQIGTQHTNSSLNANNINITTTKDTNIIGANIHATELTNLNVGGDLNIASVRDKTKSNSHSAGASIGISGGDGGVSGANAGANTANSRSITKQTVLTSLTGGKVVINTTGNTDIKGALVSSGEIDEEGKFTDNKNLTLNTGTLTHSDLSNTSYSTSTSASISVGDSTTQVGYENSTTNTKTKTLATLGEGTVTIAGEETGTDSTLNRDTDNIDKDIYDVTQQKGNVNLTVDNRILTEDGRTEIKEDFKRTEILVESVADVATKDAFEGGDLLDHIGEVQKDLDVQKAFALEDDGKYIEILGGENSTPEQKQEAITAYAQIYADTYGISIEEANIIATNKYIKGATHNESDTNNNIYINDEAQNNALDYANTMGHEVTHARVNQGTTRDREDARLNEQYAETMGGYSADGMEFSSSTYNDVELSHNSNTNTHTGNADSELIRSNTDGFVEVLKRDGDNVDFSAYYSPSDIARMNILSDPKSPIEQKINALVAVGLSPDDIKKSLGNNADFKALIKDGDEKFTEVYAEQKANVDSTNSKIDTIVTVLEVGGFIAESAVGVLALKELIAKHGIKEATKIIAKQTGKDIKEVGESIGGLLGYAKGNRRNLPGTSSYGGGLPTVKDGEVWLRGTDGNAGKIPAQIAEKLNGKEFKNFGEFREIFWKEVANDPVLSRQFTPGSRTLMKDGKAPYASKSQQVGGRAKYELDHNQEIQHGGSVFDIDNIIIRTPYNHIEKTKGNY